MGEEKERFCHEHEKAIALLTASESKDREDIRQLYQIHTESVEKINTVLLSLTEMKAEQRNTNCLIENVVNMVKSHVSDSVGHIKQINDNKENIAKHGVQFGVQWAILLILVSGLIGIWFKG